MKDYYFCGFCLSEVEAETYPEICPHCHVVRCECGTYLKGDTPKFCFGCGVIKPKTTAHFCRCGSTSGAYVSEDWTGRNLGTRCDGPYTISTGSDGSWLARRHKKDATYRDVRKLTTEEVKIVKSYVGE